MKLLLALVLALFAFIAPARAASDADVTLLKVKKVVIQVPAVGLAAKPFNPKPRA